MGKTLDRESVSADEHNRVSPRFRSVAKGNYDLVLQLRAMDTQGEVFTDVSSH